MAAVNDVRVGVGVLVRDPKNLGKVSIVKYLHLFLTICALYMIITFAFCRFEGICWVATK